MNPASFLCCSRRRLAKTKPLLAPPQMNRSFGCSCPDLTPRRFQSSATGQVRKSPVQKLVSLFYLPQRDRQASWKLQRRKAESLSMSRSFSHFQRCQPQETKQPFSAAIDTKPDAETESQLNRS